LGGLETDCIKMHKTCQYILARMHRAESALTLLGVSFLKQAIRKRNVCRNVCKGFEML
jgi:hypothetical protein